MITVVSKRHVLGESRRADGKLDSTIDFWEVIATTPAGLVTLSFPTDPTDDQILASLPPAPRRLAPTVATDKVAIKDLLDAQLGDAQAWDWFSSKIGADAGVGAAAKQAVADQAASEYAQAKRLALAWRQAT